MKTVVRLSAAAAPASAPPSSSPPPPAVPAADAESKKKKTKKSKTPARPAMATADEEKLVGPYRDDAHADGDTAGILLGEHGYKYRLLEGKVMPPYCTPARFKLSRTIQTRTGDCCYTSFPKSGSTWLANILYLVLHDGDAPADGILRANLHWLESAWTFPRGREEVDALPAPRIFKSHMPADMALAGGPALNPDCKYIYIARNPKDVAVSYYHFESHQAWSGGYDGDFSHWLQLVADGRQQRGSWWEHVRGWWALRDAPNLLFLKYEDLKRDRRGQIAKIAAYLGVELSEATLDKIVAATGFEAMKASKFAGHKQLVGFEGFFRKGAVGSWREQFTVAQSDAFDALTAERLAGSGLEFEYQ